MERITSAFANKWRLKGLEVLTAQRNELLAQDYLSPIDEFDLKEINRVIAELEAMAPDE